MWEMDYDKAANYWIEKEKNVDHMPDDILKAKISLFLSEHNTCALATASADGFVRNTPIEYNFIDNKLYLFSEGGLKFKCLKDNKNVSLAVFEPYSGFSKLKSLQIQGKEEAVEPFTDEYLKVMEYRKIPEAAMRKLPEPMNLIKVTPTSFDYLDSELKNEKYACRQHLSV
ncbi:Pyridoxamine 5'-phosphate oxidase [Pseudobutyrivibrio sp. YE44]|uniref:pyridoxamine 5'-phosphate oxidase family protein n=1 Tax=Pseudobutyrivibrio sp. YE44 TaxID=1520802 RepID=UPI00089192C6|nr:pyridoxamine 5'-phosphate oxidase family protein [Pseudobutyrivibrio sp. YE44]SDB55585.1 Pyridoxamine 5'-phosphate oxidase [Pseudobutyrivibrio sp. YE44]